MNVPLSALAGGVCVYIEGHGFRCFLLLRFEPSGLFVRFAGCGGAGMQPTAACTVPVPAPCWLFVVAGAGASSAATGGEAGKPDQSTSLIGFLDHASKVLDFQTVPLVLRGKM